MSSIKESRFGSIKLVYSRHAFIEKKGERLCIWVLGGIDFDPFYDYDI